jgi:membrane protein
VFLVGATGLRLYLDWITSTGYTYGALAAPIAFLLGMYFIALAVILGAYLNAAVQSVWPAPLRRRGRPVTHVTGPADVDDFTQQVRTSHKAGPV